MDRKNFRLADEVRYILGRAAERDGRVIANGRIIPFCTETGDAWLLDLSNQTAARLARDGERDHLTIDRKGRYRIEGAALVYLDRQSHHPRVSMR